MQYYTFFSYTTVYSHSILSLLSVLWAIPTEAIHEMEIVSGRSLDPLLPPYVRARPGTYPGSQVDKNDRHGRDKRHGWDVELPLC